MAKATKTTKKAELTGVTLVLTHQAAKDLYKTLGPKAGSSNVYDSLNQILNERKESYTSYDKEVKATPILGPKVTTVTLELTEEEAQMLNAVGYRTSGVASLTRRGLMDEISNALRLVVGTFPYTGDISTGLTFMSNKKEEAEI